MLANTKQFRKAIRQILKKHNCRIHSVNTFGTSGNYKCFSTFGKRKISFNLLCKDKEQYKAIVRDVRQLWQGTWQSNLMKYNWYGTERGQHSIEMHKEDEVLLTDARIEGTCIYKDMTQDKWKEHIKHKLKEIMWHKTMVNSVAK